MPHRIFFYKTLNYYIINVYYSGKNPLRNYKMWDDSINNTILEIKKIIKC